MGFYSKKRNLFEQQAHNKRMTFVVMAGFILFLGLLGFGFDMIMLDYFPLGTLFALAIGVGTSLWSYSSGAQSVIRSTGAYPADPNNPAHRQLINVVEEMTIASGMPRPKIYVVPDQAPNAFATGKNPEDGYVAVTEGLLRTLNREELQAVIAHEIAHIRNYDIRLMTIVAALVGAIVLLAAMARRMLWVGGGRRSGGGSSNRGGGGPVAIVILVVWIIGIILAPIIANIMAMMVSRRREYLADATAAELTRNPQGLISALHKISGSLVKPTAIHRDTAHLCISDPFRLKREERVGFLADLFATHPPVKKRVEALRNMAYQYEGTAKPQREVRG
jgi:heat shock protein HtpX